MFSRCAGRGGWGAKLSFRLTRTAIEDALGPGRLEPALHAMARLCEHLYDRGWAAPEGDTVGTSAGPEPHATARGSASAGQAGAGGWWCTVLQAMGRADRATAGLWSLMPV